MCGREGSIINKLCGAGREGGIKKLCEGREGFINKLCARRGGSINTLCAATATSNKQQRPHNNKPGGSFYSPESHPPGE